ncbi:MAG: hypothetical protein ACXVLT_09390 [Flavisolibacter sp.]
MKSKSTFSLILLATIFASCTTYKSGQTPDDVYYSPARPQGEYVQQEKNDDRTYRQDPEAYRDDRYLRMKIQDRRYSTLYDDYYSYNPYYYHYYNGSLIYNTPWSSYNYWNYYYNPYYCAPVISVVPRGPIYNRPRTFDLSVYNPQPTNGVNNPKGNARSYSVPNYSSGNSGNNNNYRNSGSDAGSFLRGIFSGSGNSGSSSTPSSNTRSSGSSSSGSSSGSLPAGRGNATRGN